MQITIKNVQKDWMSPDGKITIHSLEDQDGNKWKTMSGTIAAAEGQTMELTTRVSAKGQTYLIQPPRDGSGFEQKAVPTYTPPAQMGIPLTELMVERLEAAVEALEATADRLAGSTIDKHSGDVVPTTIPKDVDAAMTKAMSIFQEEKVTDDIDPTA